MNEYIAKIYTKITCNIFSGRFDVHLQTFEISVFDLTHKVLPSASFEIRKSLKRMPSLAYTEMDQKKIPRFIDVCIRMDYLDIVTHIYIYIIWLANFRQ